MYNKLYYIFAKDYNDDYSNSALYLKDKNNKMKILYESKDRELKYVKNKYESLCKRYNDIEWKYNELLINTHYTNESYNRLETKYNNLMKKHNMSFDKNKDIQYINDDYEHI